MQKGKLYPHHSGTPAAHTVPVKHKRTIKFAKTHFDCGTVPATETKEDEDRQWQRCSSS